MVFPRKWLTLRNASAASGSLHLSGCSLSSFFPTALAFSAVASAPMSAKATHQFVLSASLQKWSIKAWSPKSNRGERAWENAMFVAVLAPPPDSSR